MKVWAIPLAKEGFFPISPLNVKWYLEDYDNGTIVKENGIPVSFETKAAANLYAKSKGYFVKDPFVQA